MTVRRQRKVASACFTQNADHREKDGDVERPVRAPSQGRSRTVAAALTSHPDSLFPSMPFFFSRGRIGNRVAPGPEYLIMSSTAQGKKDARLSAVR